MDYNPSCVRIIAKIIPQGSNVIVNRQGRQTRDTANGEKNILIKSIKDGQVFRSRLITQNYLRHTYLFADGDPIEVIPETAFDIKYASPYLNAEP